LRALPCNPLASACFEHSIDTADRAGFAGAAPIAGAVFDVCASAEPASIKEATAAAIVVLATRLIIQPHVAPLSSG